MKPNAERRRLLQSLGIIFGGLLIVMLTDIPGTWAYNRLALRIAFGPDRAAQEHITIVSTAKPSTITFSNGDRVDVGMKPAVIGNLVHFGAAIPLLAAYALVLRRFAPNALRAWLAPRS